MSTLTYTIALRDNATNLYVTSSTIAPFYPPTSQPFSASLIDNTYTIQADSTTFSGLRQTTSATQNSYGFRIQTEGYVELALFAQTTSGVPILPTSEGVIDLGVQRIQRVQANTEKEVTSFQQVDSTAINANAPSQERAKGLDKLGQILQKKGATLQKTLVKAIVAQITAFGISNIKELIEGKVDINKLPRICPTQQKILQLIALRDRYTTQLNTYYTNITGLSKGLTGTQQVSEAIATVITITSATRQAANAALAFVPLTPGAVPSSINILKDLEDIIKPRLDKILKTVQTLSSAVAFVSAILIVIIQLLRLLDILIQLCAQDLGVPYQAINTELALLGGNTLSDLQNSTSTVDNTYKGFKFEILQDTANSTKYPLRYAVGKDKYGVILLKSEASFTPNPNILIDELKFIIDRDNLSAE